MVEITKDILFAKSVLDEGNIVAIPTETVYGLAANGTSVQALKKIFRVKGRPINNPLILHFGDFNSITPFVNGITTDVEQLANAFWPGPLTLLLPRSKKVPDIVTAGSNRVAVRIPNHSMTIALLKSLDYPLAAPSANPSGYISPTKPQHVEKQLGQSIPLILDGGSCKSGIESTILGWENGIPTIYRTGVITSDMIAKVLGKAPEFNKKSDVLEAPGMMSSHYAPKTKTLVTDDIPTLYDKHKNEDIGLITFQQNTGLKIKKEIVLSSKASLEEMAEKLYAAMHLLDGMDLDVIIIEKAPDEGIGRAINDRLERSSFKK
ncbi:MAG: L-threonylcarbamoyladenylate synthase [Croceivirga sp.]